MESTKRQRGVRNNVTMCISVPESMRDHIATLAAQAGVKRSHIIAWMVDAIDRIGDSDTPEGRLNALRGGYRGTTRW